MAIKVSEPTAGITSEAIIHNMSAAVAFLFITFLHILIGDERLLAAGDDHLAQLGIGDRLRVSGKASAAQAKTVKLTPAENTKIASQPNRVSRMPPISGATIKLGSRSTTTSTRSCSTR